MNGIQAITIIKKLQSATIIIGLCMVHGRQDAYRSFNTLVDRHVAAGTVREDLQRLLAEGVSTVALETMKEIKNRI